MIAGRLSKTSASVVLTGNVIKRLVKLPLTIDEEQAGARLSSVGRAVVLSRPKL